MKLIKNIFLQFAVLVFCILGFSHNASATHIVGGDMTYKCLGNERYEITLTVRRDCAFGSPFAPFDNPASIGFFDSDGNLDFNVGIAGQILIPFVQDDTLNYQINSDCGFVGAPICVHEATYTKVVRLPFRAGGYTAAYQRCCRNGSLNNIVGPLETGSTYFIEFTEEALRVCNSSPVFNQWPDIYICANQVLDFDHMATDPDGDELVYSLCKPYDGASFDLPKPQPPNGPGYTPVTHQPPYTEFDPLGGTPLTIDPNTGQMTAVPNLIGQFLVGICVDEYRDGVLLSRVIRDFQYNVRVCSESIVADFDVEPVICGTTEVPFQNTSQGTDSYIWNFDYPNTDPAFISSDIDPVFNYPNYGTYVVQLEAIRSVDGCSNIFLDTILITDTAIDADFGASFYSCENDVYILELEDYTSLSMGMANISSWTWTISQGGQVYTETGNTVTLNLDNPDNLTISLEVILNNGCKATLTKTASLETISLNADILLSIDACGTDDVTYTLMANNLPAGLPNVTWTINDGGSTVSFTGNPIMYTTANNVISGILETMSSNCISSQSFSLNTEDFTPQVDIDYAVQGCNSSGLLTVDLNALVINSTTLGITSYEWIVQNGSTITLSGNPQAVELDPTLNGQIVLNVSFDNGCTFSDTLSVEEMNPFDFQYTETVTLCKADKFDLSIPQSPGTSIQWTNNPLLQNPLNVFDQLIEIPVDQVSGSEILYFTITDANGCSMQFEVSVIIDTHPALFATHTEIDCDTYYACFENISPVITPVEWTFSDDFGNILGTSLDIMPCFTFPGKGEYHITLSGQSDSCPGIPFVYCVVFNDPTIEIINPQSEINACLGDQILLEADASLENDSIKWCDISGGTELLLGTGPSLTFTPTDGQEVVAKISEIKGCVEYSDVIKFNVDDLDLGVVGDMVVCKEDLIVLDVFNGSTYNFVWEDNDFIIAGQNTPTPTISIPLNTANGSYSLNFQVSNGSCTTSSSLVLNVIDNPLLSYDYFISDCTNYTVCFNSTSSINTSLVWDFGDLNSTLDVSTDSSPCYTYGAEGAYTVSLMLEGGACAGSSISTAINVGLPIIEILDLDIDGNFVFCSADEIELMANANAIGTITWYDASGNVLGQGASLFIDPVDGMEIYASILSLNGCQSETVSTILVDNSIEFNIDLNTAINVCQGNSGMLNIASSQNITFSWNTHPLLTDGLDTDNPSYSIPADYPLGSVILSFTAQNDLGCSGDYQLELNVIDGEDLSFTYTVTDCDTYTVCFENTSNTGSSVSWNFGDLNSVTDISTDQNPCYSYGVEGSFDVVMTTTDGDCAGASTTMNIVVEKPLIEILNLDLNGNYIFCSNEMIELTASSTTSGTINWFDINGAPLGQGSSIMVTPFDGVQIFVSITSDTGCTSDRVSTTLVDGSLDLDIFSPLSLCRGTLRDLIILTSQNIVFNWDAHPLLVDGLDTATPTISIPTDYPLGSVIFTFSAENDLGCSGDFTYEVVVGDGETLTFDYNVTDCDNYVVCFENTSGSTSIVSWDFGDLTSTTDISLDQTPCYTYGADGTYTVTMTTIDGSCPGSEVSADITTAKPTLEILNVNIDGNTIFCSTEMIELTASSASTGTITWYDSNGAPLGTGTSIMITPFAGIEISASIVAENGCESARVTTTLVDSSLDLDIFQPITLCRGDSRDLVILSAQNVTYNWDTHPLLTDGLDTDSPTVTIPADYPLGSVVFTFSASNDIGCSESYTYQIIVIENEPLSFTYEVTDCENFEVCFTNTSPMNGILIWDFGDLTTTSDVSPENNPCYIYPGPGTYQVTLNTVTGSCAGIPDTLDIILNAVPDIEILNLPDTVFVCNTEPISVSAFTSLPGGMIEWCDSNGVVLGTGPSIEVIPDGDDLILIAKAIDPNGCSYPSEPVAFIMGDLELDFDSPLDICKGDTVTLDINPQAGITFAWNASPYIISGEDTGNPVIYIDPSVNITSLVLGFVASSDTGCGGQFAYEINIIDNAIMDFDFVVTDCENYTVCFENTSNVTTNINWDFGDPTIMTDVSSDNNPCYTYPGPGVYTVSLSSEDIPGACMSVPFSMDITLNELPFITLDSSMMDQTVCSGDTITLAGSSYLDIPISWCLSDGTPLGVGDTIDVAVNMDMDIIAKIEDDNACMDTSDITDVDVYQFDLTVVDPPVFCGVDTAIITIIDNAGNPDLIYQWSPDECILSGSDTPTPLVTSDVSKDLMVLVTDTLSGCSVVLIVPITVSDLDISTTDDFTIIQGNSGTIEVFGTDVDDTVTWSNGSSEIEQEVAPLETTTYTVTVTDINGCTATAAVTITVNIPRCDDEAVFIPNAFSPNGDGNNDILYVRGLYIQSMEFIIFNRWGQEIFKTTDLRSGWDGTYKGKTLSPDSYAFCIRATCINGEENIRTGNVSLLR